MTIRPIHSEPADDVDVARPFGGRVPVDAEFVPPVAVRRHDVAKRWLVRALVFAGLVSLFWLIGWGVVGAWFGWWMAGIGGVGLLPYLLILDWKWRP